jgi:hypothetical protein
MANDPELPNIADDPTMRRLWLLSKALEAAPLDRAIELARTADEFLTAGPTVRRTIAAMERNPASQGERVQAAPATAPEAPLRIQQPKPKQTGLTLSSENREQLLDRLAAGATNAELAGEFGLGARQVQGIRMGAAREIANRRNRQPNPPAPRAEDTPAADPEEVVRDLRQQDEVVAPQDGDEFGGSSQAAHSVSTNAHPIFQDRCSAPRDPGAVPRASRVMFA